jgi:hypothetical protein
MLARFDGFASKTSIIIYEYMVYIIYYSGRIISSKFDMSFSDRKALERLRTAILRGIGWFRIFYPNKFAHIVLDEVTFLIPNPADPEAVKASKRSCFEQLQALAVILGHEFRSCRVVMSSSSPEILQMMGTTRVRFILVKS